MFKIRLYIMIYKKYTSKTHHSISSAITTKASASTRA